MSSILQRCGKIRIRINGNEMDHGWEPSNTTTQAPPKEALHSSVQPIQQKMLREQPDRILQVAGRHSGYTEPLDP